MTKLKEGTDERCCGACANFKYEDFDGYGFCDYVENRKHETHCSLVCKDNFKEDVREMQIF